MVMDVMSKGGVMREQWETARQLAGQVRDLPLPLVVIAGTRGTGKTGLAKWLADEGFGTYVNLNLVLARHLTSPLEGDGSLTASTAAELLNDAGKGDPVVLDNIEVVFHSALRLSPLHWFQHMARVLPFVVVWPGPVRNGEFVYSMPNRPDYFHTRDPAVMVVNLDT